MKNKIMKNKIKFGFFGVFLVLISGIAFFSFSKKSDFEKAVVERDIEKYYLVPVFFSYDTDLMKKGFDESFFFASIKDKKIDKVTLSQFMERVAKRKENPPKDKWTYKIQVLDITENNVASAKVLLYKDEKLFFTDYLHLLKENDQWKIIGKVFYKWGN